MPALLLALSGLSIPGTAPRAMPTALESISFYLYEDFNRRQEDFRQRAFIEDDAETRRHGDTETRSG